MPAIEEVEDYSPLHVPQGILDDVEDMGSNTSKDTLTVAKTSRDSKLKSPQGKNAKSETRKVSD